MDIYIEFISNNMMLFIPLVIIIVLLVQTIFSDATRKYERISPPQVVKLINREDAVLIDTRNDSEFKSGHIAGAISIPLPDIKANSSKLNKYEGKPLVFYCKTDTRSDEACDFLSKEGFTNIFTLSGGIHSWQEASMPLVK